jgi:HYR domain-containing protein
MQRFTRLWQALAVLLFLLAGAGRAGAVTINFGNVEVGRTVSINARVIPAPGCTGAVSYSITGPAAGDFHVIGPSSIATANPFLITIQFTPSQLGSRTATISFTIGNVCGGGADLVGTGVPPRIICPGNITRSNDPNQCGAVVNYPAPTAIGNAGTIVCTPASGSFFPVGTTTVNCTSTSGATCSFTVTVKDTQPPKLTCPDDITVNNDPGKCGAVVNYAAPTVTDNCPGVGPITCAPPSGSLFPVGATTVACTVVDAAGNTATCTFTITVKDTEPPTITCPPSVTLPQDPGMRGTTFHPDPAQAQDNCPGVVVTGQRSDAIPISDPIYPVGVTMITWTATDTSGNKTSCMQTVSVRDSRIVGVVGQDTNGNHLPDPPQEPRLKGVTIELHDAGSNALLATTQTDLVGNFSFPVAPPGVYDVVVKLAPGQTISALFPGPSNKPQIVTVNGEQRLRVTMQAGDTVAGLGILLQ